MWLVSIVALTVASDLEFEKKEACLVRKRDTRERRDGACAAPHGTPPAAEKTTFKQLACQSLVLLRACCSSIQPSLNPLCAFLPFVPFFRPSQHGLLNLLTSFFSHKFLSLFDPAFSPSRRVSLSFRAALLPFREHLPVL